MVAGKWKLSTPHPYPHPPATAINNSAPCLEGLEADADIEGLGGKTWAAEANLPLPDMNFHNIPTYFEVYPGISKAGGL